MEPDQSSETAFSRLMQECFRTNRQLVAAVAQLTNGSGISGAQWGVLGAIGGSDEALTVAQAARRLGLARQGVQRVADLLEKKELIEYLPNPNHRRAKLAGVTDRGRNLLDQLRERESRWAQRAAGDLDIKEVEAATGLVRSIRERLLDYSVTDD
jgi:DNA-binding MarR family transcriptional regulator